MPGFSCGSPTEFLNRLANPQSYRSAATLGHRQFEIADRNAVGAKPIGVRIICKLLSR